MIYKQKFLKKQSPKMFGSSRSNNTSTSKLLSAKGCFFYSLLILGSFYIAPSHADQQEDIITACNEAARLLKDDNDISAALEEARWCVEGLEQMKTQIAQNVKAAAPRKHHIENDQVRRQRQHLVHRGFPVFVGMHGKAVA